MDTGFFKRQMRLLHLEDDENDRVLVLEMLRADGLPCQVMQVKNRADFETALLRSDFDLIISDFSIPSFDGLSALSIARQLSPAIPFIFFSGTIGEEVAVESLKNGATDYILKQRPHRLIPAVRSALHNAEERFRRRRAEIELKKIEDRFRVISHATNDVVWEWDVKTSHLWLSENFKSVFGHPPETISPTFESWLDLIHPVDKSRVVSGMTSLIAVGGRVWWSEHRFRRADGSYAHVYDRASALYDSDGKLTRMVGVTIDMTERKHIENKIVEQAALLDETRDAIMVVDPKGLILFWNKGAERIYGWTAREVNGKVVHELLRPGASLSQTAMTETLKVGHWVGEMRERVKSGSEAVVQSRWTLLRDDRGNLKSIMIINTDVTEHKQLEDQFLRTQRLESLGSLVSGIVHDLNNAIVPIIVGVQILLGEDPAPETESLLRTMETSANRSADMLKQMLTFARGGEMQKVIVQPEELVGDISRIIKDTFLKSIQCRVQVEQKLPPILAIPTQLYQVLLNLCVNARDAMPDGGTITLSAGNAWFTAEQAARHQSAKPSKYVCFSVADTGEGIPPERMKKIFQPFFTTKAPGKGTGLGLSTACNIIKNHGGFMTVESQVGRGADFKVYLPLANQEPVEPQAEKVLLPAGGGECILVIDDEASMLAIMRATLENYGYTVVTALSGPEAITRLSTGTPVVDLVITDLVMPFMDGKATIAALQKISPGIKTIAVSGSEETAKDARHQLNADAFIAKPFTNETLVKSVQQVLWRQKKA